jgi:glycosyltransferase involved in cell wall biosynthesis
MRIRFFSAFEPPFSFYRDLLPFLANQGADINLIVGNLEYRAGRRSLTVALDHPNIEISHIRVVEVAASSTLQKASVYLTYMIIAAFRTLLGRSVDLNFFLTQPPLFAVWGYFLKILRGQQYCVLVMDLYPDIVVRGGMLPEHSWLTYILTKLSRLALRRADLIIVLGRCMHERLEKEGVLSDRIHVIRNWENNNAYPVPHNINNFRKELGLDEDFVILYSGNIGFSHFFDDILDVATHLRNLKDLHFVFVGEGVRRKEIEQVKEERSLENIILLPFQPVNRLAHSLSMGDLHFISLKAGFEGLVVPSKAYSALAVGRAILYQGDHRGEIARMVEEELVGTVVPLHDAKALESAILCYYHNQALTIEQGLRAHKLVNNRFGRESSLKRYAEVLLNL